MKLIIETYEGNDTTPVLSHVFYGKTASEVNAVVKASMTTGSFKGIPLRNRTQWVK